MAKDVALFNILTNNLMSVAREMSADFLRSAYSVVIREAADCSTFLADAKGRILAQPQDQPLTVLVRRKPVRHHCREEVIFLCRGLTTDGPDHLHHRSCPGGPGCPLPARRGTLDPQGKEYDGNAWIPASCR